MSRTNVIAVRTNHSLAPYIRGAVHLEELGDGFVLPHRFFPEQMDHLEQIGRYDRAVSTAGVVLDFATNGTEVSLDCRVVRPLDTQHPLYHEVMEGGTNGGVRPFGRAEEGNMDGIDLVVDGRLVATVAPVDGTLRFAFSNPDHEELEVRIYLPNIMAVAVGNLRTNGSLKPVPARGYLLALGDSITQGFVCGRPSFSFPAQVAATLGIDLLNQAIAGHVFDADSMGGISLWRGEAPEVIVVAYGTNDWARMRSMSSIEGGAAAFFDRLSWAFPKVPVYVLSPLWRADEHDPMPCGEPLTRMHQMLGRVCSRHNNVRMVDGYHGIPKDPSLFADGRLHPGPECMGLVADLLLEAMCADSVDLAVAKRVAKRVARSAGVGDTSGFVSFEEEIDRRIARRDHSPETHPEFDRLVRTIWRLRQPDGCPWDKAQTHQSITKNMVEEAYEAVEALAQDDTPHMVEELGDVLEQVLLHSQIADDAGTFDIDDVCRELNQKLIRRHPHVFGSPAGGKAPSRLNDDGSERTPDEVLDIWDDVKRAEREGSGDGVADKPAGLLDSVPVSLPALMQAQKISKRAAKAGFEWDTVADVWDKVAEERAEFEREEPGTQAAAEEFGDLLFALVNVARHCGIDAEEALAASNRKFRRRWAAMEAQQDLAGLTTQQLNDLWDRVKVEQGTC